MHACRSTLEDPTGSALLAELERSHAEPAEVTAALELFDVDTWLPSSAPGTITITRAWPDDTLDTVIVLSADTAYARRDTPAAGLVWHLRGELTTVVCGVLGLPAPDDPDAPTTSLSRGLW